MISVQCRLDVTPSKSVTDKVFVERLNGRLFLLQKMTERKARVVLPAGVNLSPCSISSPDMMNNNLFCSDFLA